MFENKNCDAAHPALKSLIYSFIQTLGGARRIQIAVFTNESGTWLLEEL